MRRSTRFISAAAAVFFVVTGVSACSSTDTKDQAVVSPTATEGPVTGFVRDGQVLHVSRNDVTVNVQASGGELIFQGDGLTVTVSGSVGDLILTGSNNTVTSGDADWLEVNGSSNTVKAGGVSSTVRIEGSRNNVSFSGGPSVRVRGSSNTVNGKPQ